MNQNIVRGSEDLTWHSQGKTNTDPSLQLSIQFKKHTAGRDVPRQGGNLAVPGSQQHRQCERKTNRASHLLP
jgi:hypothetical protein